MKSARRAIGPAIVALVFFSSACQSPTDTEPGSSEHDGLRLAGAPARVDICHRTGSETNPWVPITVSERAVQKHLDRHGDAIPNETEIEPGTVLDDSCTPVSTGEPDECDSGGGNCAGQIGGGDGGTGEGVPGL